jgi:hypothetical protein
MIGACRPASRKGHTWLVPEMIQSASIFAQVFRVWYWAARRQENRASEIMGFAM